MPRRVLIPLIVACALFMENLDSTVLSTALPAIAASFGESPVRLNLAITAYLFSLAVFIPVSGWIADRFGARRVFTLAIAVFTLGSILCGLSGSLVELVLARILQGLGGAMMVPVGRLVVLRAVTKPELVRAMAYLTMPALVGPVIGPPLGGFLATYLSWRWIFWINIPIGIVGIALALLYIEDTREQTVPPLDVRGLLLTAVGFTALVFGFETIGRDVLPAGVTAALLVVGATALAVYVRHARRVTAPVLDLSLFRIPTLRMSLSGGFLFRVGAGASPFLLPLMLQIGFGLTAFSSGLITFVSAVGAIAMKVAAAPILNRFGFRSVLIGNGLLCAVFFAVYGLFRPDTATAVMLLVLLGGGFLRSLQFTSLNSLAFADVPAERMSRATSLSGTAQQLATSVGVGVGALILHLAMMARGSDVLALGDFTIAFLVVAAIVAASALVFVFLDADAGAEVSGHVPKSAPHLARSDDATDA